MQIGRNEAQSCDKTVPLGTQWLITEYPLEVGSDGANVSKLNKTGSFQCMWGEFSSQTS